MLKKKLHLVDWNSVCKTKRNGGLGIKPLKILNQVLLGKWLWRLGEGDNLCRQIILTKYKVDGDGWDVSRLSYRQSALWKGIISVKDRFALHIILKVGLGRNILFWQDVCLGDRSLVDQFLDLHRCARDGWGKVVDYMERSSDNVIWTPIFRRNLLP